MKSRYRAPLLLGALLLPACGDSDDDPAAPLVLDSAPAGGGAPARPSSPAPVAAPRIAATLSGEQAGTGSDGRGPASVDVHPERLDVSWEAGGVSGVLGAKIRLGAPGQDGTWIFEFTEPRVALDGDDLQPRPEAGVHDFADAREALLSGRAYLVVRTLDHPEGELRGHLGPATLRRNGALFRLNAAQDEIRYEVPRDAELRVGGAPAIFVLPAPSGVLRASDLRPRAERDVVDFADAVDALLSGRARVV